jgi:hypothetical protein
MKNLFFLLLLALSISVSAQVGINTDGSVPDNSAMLDVKSTTKGLLVPRMTLAQRNAIPSPANGLMIYQTDNTPGFYYNSGIATIPAWVMVGTGSGWGPMMFLLHLSYIISWLGKLSIQQIIPL